MNIPLLIGKNSNGEDQFLDLTEIPLLMISYYDEKQLNLIFSRILKIEYPHMGFNYLITNTRKLKEWKLDFNNVHIFLRDDPESDLGNTRSREVLVSLINKELIKRKKLMNRKKIRSFNRDGSLYSWNKEKLGYCFLLIDDIWDIVTAKPKSIALNMIYILLNGPSFGIHTVFASAISYRNLLDQLIKLHPKIKLELQKKYGIPEPNKISALGHEIIFSPDGLIFFKDVPSNELTKYYP